LRTRNKRNGSKTHLQGLKIHCVLFLL
jgi:hypothetical protein